jgi:hypothetical protein
MKFHDRSRRFDLNWLLPLDEEAEFEQVDALFELFQSEELNSVESRSRDAAIERLYTEGGIFCPLCGAVYDRVGSIAR